jgi:serine protease AprX
LDRLEPEVQRVGGKDIRKASLAGQLFCELTGAQKEALARIPGVKIRELKSFKAEQLMAPPLTTMAQASGIPDIRDIFLQLQNYFSPPLTGTGLTVAVLDTGIRKTHEALHGRVVYEANFTNSPSCEDIFDHGTSVAYEIANLVSPGAKLANIKVIGDDGIGYEEDVIMGIDEACALARGARERGLSPTDDLYPNVVNLSLGTPDDGDPDNPTRVAARKAITDYGLDVIAAAGNGGPSPSTITLPACDPEVIAVGAIEKEALAIWENSSRGPTFEGNTKPDFVLWGTNMDMASAKGDSEYVSKSGTSFSAPLLSGLTGLIWETGRRAQGEWWIFSWKAFQVFAPFFCLKAEDAPVKKDNSWGYGLPAMNLMFRETAGAPSPDQQAMQATANMINLFMLGLTMAGMASAIL